MSLWIELHCDIRDMSRTTATGELACWTHSNANEGLLTESTGNDARAAATLLAKRARAKGWRRTRNGWACPACAKTPQAKSGGGTKAERAKKTKAREHAAAKPQGKNARERKAQVDDAPGRTDQDRREAQGPQGQGKGAASRGDTPAMETQYRVTVTREGARGRPEMDRYSYGEDVAAKAKAFEEAARAQAQTEASGRPATVEVEEVSAITQVRFEPSETAKEQVEAATATPEPAPSERRAPPPAAQEGPMQVRALAPDWYEGAKRLVAEMEAGLATMADALEARGLNAEAAALRAPKTTPNEAGNTCSQIATALAKKAPAERPNGLGAGLERLAECAQRLHRIDMVTMSTERIEREIEALERTRAAAMHAKPAPKQRVAPPETRVRRPARVAAGGPVWGASAAALAR